MAHPLIVACMVILTCAVLICMFYPNVFWQTPRGHGVGSAEGDTHPSSDDYWATLTLFFRC